MAGSSFEKALEQAARRFAEEIVGLIRTTTVEDLAALGQQAPPDTPKRQGRPPKPSANVQAAADPIEAKPKRRGRPPKAETAPATAKEPPKRRGRPPKKAPPVEAVEAVAKKKPRKKREWPKCTVEGCGKNVYMPSGARKMCYQHNLEHGGKPTPLAKVNKARSAGKAAAKPKAPAKATTKIRKKANKAGKPTTAAKK